MLGWWSADVCKIPSRRRVYVFSEMAYIFLDSIHNFSLAVRRTRSVCRGFYTSQGSCCACTASCVSVLACSNNLSFLTRSCLREEDRACVRPGFSAPVCCLHKLALRHACFSLSSSTYYSSTSIQQSKSSFFRVMERFTTFSP